MTLDEDVAARLREISRERGISFKEALNGAVRKGLGAGPAARPYRVPARRMGLREGVDLDHALALAGRLEDEELIRRLARGT